MITPPRRSENPQAFNSPFTCCSESYYQEGAEIGLLCFSPPNKTFEELMKRPKENTFQSDFEKKIRFGTNDHHNQYPTIIQ